VPFCCATEAFPTYLTLSIPSLHLPTSRFAMTKDKRSPTNRARKSRASNRPQRTTDNEQRTNSYHLVIPCRDESHQRALYHQLTASGHPVRVLTL